MYPHAFDGVVLKPLMADPVRRVVGALHEVVDEVRNVHDDVDADDGIWLGKKVRTNLEINILNQISWMNTIIWLDLAWREKKNFYGN